MKVLLDEFSDIMSEIELVYGEMKPDKLNTYFKYLGEFSREILQDAIKEVIQSSEYNRFPTIGRIYAVAAQLRSQRKLDSRPVYCYKCDSSGMIMVEIPEGQPTVYRCDCKNGGAYRKTLPPYDKEKRSLPFDPLMKKLGVIRYSEVLKDRSIVFPEGATVIFPCKSEGCIAEYTVDFKRQISAAETIEAYKIASQGKAGGLCDSCYYLAGKYYFLWT